MVARRHACLLAVLCPAALVRAQGLPALRIAWSDYPPFQVRGDNGQPQGLDVELIELIALEAGEKLAWSRRPWARQVPDIGQGELDLMGSATPSPERLALGEFTLPYRQERVALIALGPEAAPVRRLADLKGRNLRIGFIRGVAFPAAVRQALEDPELASLLVPLYANDLTLSALRGRRVDYVIDDPTTLLQRAERQPGEPLKVVLELAVSPVHLFVSRHVLQQRPDLVKRLNQAIQRARQRPDWQRVLARYPGAST
ncbi:MAG: transporter substrate-binding domain-containing protein [Methylotenera sp.]|jgi:polar amino acid transport system substrate-binding protein|nr:transporter substrate-binding domain-containing protein [Methylotenera sp.]